MQGDGTSPGEALIENAENNDFQDSIRDIDKDTSPGEAWSAEPVARTQVLAADTRVGPDSRQDGVLVSSPIHPKTTAPTQISQQD